MTILKLLKANNRYWFLLAILFGGLFLACCFPSLEGMATLPPSALGTVSAEDKAKLATMQAQVAQMFAETKM